MNKPFVAIAVAAVTILVAIFRGRVFGFIRAQANKPTRAFVADPANDKRVVVLGWANDEVRSILQDFAKLYDLPESFVSQVPTADYVLLSFPNDISSDLYFFLVNYLNYPERYELKGRDIAVVGKATLTPAFGAPDSSLVGKQARIYVPAQDEDLDVVHVAVSTGESYENSFATHRWKRVEESRMPNRVREL